MRSTEPSSGLHPKHHPAPPHLQPLSSAPPPPRLDQGTAPSKPAHSPGAPEANPTSSQPPGPVVPHWPRADLSHPTEAPSHLQHTVLPVSGAPRGQLGFWARRVPTTQPRPQTVPLVPEETYPLDTRTLRDTLCSLRRILSAQSSQAPHTLSGTHQHFPSHTATTLAVHTESHEHPG